MDFEASLGHHQSVILYVSRRCREAGLLCFSNFCFKGDIMKARFKFYFLNQMVRSIQNIPSISVCKLV